jgi:beta-glucosidase
MVPDKSFSGSLGIITQDKMRVYIDDKLFTDNWDNTQICVPTMDFSFEPGRKYKVMIEYVKKGNGSLIVFGYNKSEHSIESAVKLARDSKIVILALGESQKTCGEGFDRCTLDLTGRQMDLLKVVHETGTPVVLVLQNGRPLTINWAAEHVPAILECWYPGEFGGQAIAEVIFGKYNPAGRLPVTFPANVGQIPVCYNAKRAVIEGRYADGDRKPLYPFGFGLSYTTFAYSNLKIVPEKVSIGLDITVQVIVTNTGTIAGDEVVQLYVHDVIASTARPVRELKGFQRVHILPGEKQEVKFVLKQDDLAVWSMENKWQVEPGEFEIFVSGGNPDTELKSRFIIG